MVSGLSPLFSAPSPRSRDLGPSMPYLLSPGTPGLGEHRGQDGRALRETDMKKRQRQLPGNSSSVGLETVPFQERGTQSQDGSISIFASADGFQIHLQHIIHFS